MRQDLCPRVFSPWPCYLRAVPLQVQDAPAAPGTPGLAASSDHLGFFRIQQVSLSLLEEMLVPEPEGPSDDDVIGVIPPFQGRLFPFHPCMKSSRGPGQTAGGKRGNWLVSFHASIGFEGGFHRDMLKRALAGGWGSDSLCSRAF